eukprot:COSAG02_NODE_9220_length_2285_cov_2.246569_3_plen_86_part_00
MMNGVHLDFAFFFKWFQSAPETTFSFLLVQSKSFRLDEYRADRVTGLLIIWYWLEHHAMSIRSQRQPKDLTTLLLIDTSPALQSR